MMVILKQKTKNIELKTVKADFESKGYTYIGKNDF